MDQIVFVALVSACSAVLGALVATVGAYCTAKFQGELALKQTREQFRNDRDLALESMRNEALMSSRIKALEVHERFAQCVEEHLGGHLAQSEDVGSGAPTWLERRRELSALLTDVRLVSSSRTSDIAEDVCKQVENHFVVQEAAKELADESFEAGFDALDLCEPEYSACRRLLSDFAVSARQDWMVILKSDEERAEALASEATAERVRFYSDAEAQELVRWRCDNLGGEFLGQ